MTVTQSLIGCVNSAGDRKRKVRSLVITGGCTVRSNGHPSPSNTIGCFPSLGLLPFQQEGQFSVCLQMWKYTVYVYERMHAHVNSAFKHACLAPFMPVCVRVDGTNGFWDACSCSASLWTDWPAVLNSRVYLKLIDSLYLSWMEKWAVYASFSYNFYHKFTFIFTRNSCSVRLCSKYLGTEEKYLERTKVVKQFG